MEKGNKNAVFILCVGKKGGCDGDVTDKFAFVML